VDDRRIPGCYQSKEIAEWPGEVFLQPKIVADKIKQAKDKVLIAFMMGFSVSYQSGAEIHAQVVKITSNVLFAKFWGSVCRFDHFSCKIG
jgi:hypothetical protein